MMVGTEVESVPLRVFWSDRLENLADQLFAEWEKMPVRDPFARICVVVGDLSTRSWLQRYFLLHRKSGACRILANIDFKPIAEFVNDWLAAEVHGKDGAHRRPSEHPYSKGVLAWRINAILKAEAHNPDLAIPLAYIAQANNQNADQRRFELASRLAELFDDYQENRYQMLANWEAGRIPSGDERWQAVLYRLLVQESPGTYTHDYVRALSEAADPSVAFLNGFQRYAAIHVFDVATAPWPYLSMLKKMSEVVPTTFWTFNPSYDYWFDERSRHQVYRDKARELRQMLQRGETPQEDVFDYIFDTPDSRLLGALASGTRAMLSAQLDLVEGDCRWVGDQSIKTFSSLGNLTPEVHVCHSPRRELEVARDALHRFFSETPDAHPSDALVLCADWGTYSPLIESVFGTGSDERIPFALDVAVREMTPISHSLGALFDFRTNRFEVNAVFALLGVPAIRRCFGIGANDLSVLREMVRENNIRWGYDDKDVNEILDTTKAEEVYPFTWRRGLDRFIADALIGSRNNDERLVDVGCLGRLLPCGNIEAERSRLVGALDTFVEKLSQLRSFLKSSHGIEDWRDRLLNAINEFYQGSESEADELTRLRSAIVSATDEALIARTISKNSRSNYLVSGDVMCAAVLGAVKSCMRRSASHGNAVRFAPLGNGTAMPARFVWICGLNNGTFPRAEHRPSFDLIGRHPTLFDVTARDKDVSALLKAALGARDRLSLSYIGRDVRSNEEVPAAVPLIDLIEWFRGVGGKVITYNHPLQAYSTRYFMPKSDLPPSYSSANYDAAVAVLKVATKDSDAQLSVAPFPLAQSGETIINLEDLIAFCARPNNFIARRLLGVRIAKPKYDLLSDDDVMEASLQDDFVDDVLLGRKKVDDISIKVESERMVEKGLAANYTQAYTELKTKLSDEEIKEFQSKLIDFAKNSEEQLKFGCPNIPVVDGIRRFESMEVTAFSVELLAKDNKVILEGCHRPAIWLKNGAGNEIPYAFIYNKKFWDSNLIAAWIRHLVRQVDPCSEGCVTVLVSPEWASVRIFSPVSADDARKRLADIVALVVEPMLVDLKQTIGKEELPKALATAVDGKEFLKYKGQRKK